MGKAGAKYRKLLGLGTAIVPLATIGLIGATDAKITRIEIAKTTQAFEGAMFGAVGAYEQLDGTAYGEIDPRDPLNALVQDIELAPRNARGMVEYSMGISILKPVDMSKGNRTLLYETVNRGRKNLPFLNIGGDVAKAGDGFLEREGYTQAWSGWEGDITTGLRITLPVAIGPSGSPITGPVRAEYVLAAPVATVNVTAPPAYEAASLDNSSAVLTRRVHEGDARETIDGSKWAFADCTNTPFPGKPDPAKVCLDGGFDTNHIYELVYTAKNPTVAGIGFAATRDFAALLRGDPGAADPSVANPVAGGIDNALIFGSSQSGRWVRTFTHLGFNESESHRRVFDGAIPHKASNRGAFNVRWAQPNRLSGTQHTEALYPGQESPQTFDVSTDPTAGVTGGQLERCRKSQTCPKITATFTDTEYWQALMALNTTDAAGEKDLAIPPEVRLYFFAGTQHGGGDQLRQPPFVQPKPPLACQLPVNPNSFFPAQRALLVALRDWIVSGKEPPASVYPTIARKSLVPVAQVKFPYVAASEFSPQGVAAQRKHLYRGADFREADIAGVMAEPPRVGRAYPVLLPQVDADGNHTDGLLNTAVQVPLGTYTGWNVRKAGFSEGDSCDLIGAFIPFFRTKVERMAANDPRPSLEERYPTHDFYVEKVRAAAARLVADRFLLPQDAELIVAQAQGAAIP
jgi:alpha/beta hydrolase family protein